MEEYQLLDHNHIKKEERGLHLHGAHEGLDEVYALKALAELTGTVREAGLQLLRDVLLLNVGATEEEATRVWEAGGGLRFVILAILANLIGTGGHGNDFCGADK